MSAPNNATLFPRRPLESPLNLDSLAAVLGKPDVFGGIPLDWITDGSRRAGSHLLVSWRDVCEFDDVALIHLVLIEDILRRKGVAVSHSFQDDMKRYARGEPCQRSLKELTRDLSSVGFFNLCFSDHWDVPQDKSRLRDLQDAATFGSLQPPVAEPYSILPLLCCHWDVHQEADSAATESVHEFASRAIQKLDPELAEEFCGLLLHQLRGNVSEHAYIGRPSRSIGVAMARLYPLSQGTVSRQGLVVASNLVKCVAGSCGEADGVIEVMTADSGLGIAETLKNTWLPDLLPGLDPHELADFRTVRESIKNWAPRDLTSQVVEFATTKYGTRKEVGKHRSFEPPGLNRVDRDLVMERGGILEISCNGRRITHDYTSDSDGDRTYRSSPIKWTAGTTIRIAIPVRSRATSRSKSRPSIADDMLPLPLSTSDAPIVVESLSDSIPRSNPGLLPDSENLTEWTREANKMFSAFLRSLEHTEPSKALALDWGELPSNEHYVSTFFQRLYEMLAEPNSSPLLRSRPFLFINVPRAIESQAPTYIRKLGSLANRMPIPVFYEDWHEHSWFGIDRYAKDLKQAPGFGPESKRKNLLDALLMTVLRSDCQRAPIEVVRLYAHSNKLDDDGMAKALAALERKDHPFISRLVTALGSILHASPFFEPEMTKDRTRKTYETEEDSEYDGFIRTGAYSPIVEWQQITGCIFSTFQNRLHKACESLAVCFVPADNCLPSCSPRLDPEYIQLPSKRCAKRYYHIDGLIEGAKPDGVRFRMLLAKHLGDLAVRISRDSRDGVELVVSCTSPTNWFVHQIADAINRRGGNCSHLVSRSLQSFSTELKGKNARPGMNVLIFSDVISSGTTVERMAQSCIHNKLEVVGLIAIIDARPEKSNSQASFAQIPAKSVYVLTRHDPEIGECSNPAWRVDPQTLQPVSIDVLEGWPGVLSGTGEAGIALSGETAELLLKNWGCLRHKHFRFGHHHSNLVRDMHRIYESTALRDLILNRLYSYIRRHGITTVVYPNHSNAYRLINHLDKRLHWHMNASCQQRDLDFRLALRREAPPGFPSYVLGSSPKSRPVPKHGMPPGDELVLRTSHPLEIADRSADGERALLHVAVDLSSQAQTTTYLTALKDSSDTKRTRRISSDEKVLVYDDGAITSGALSNMIAEVRTGHGDCEIHVVVFCDGLLHSRQSFWRTIDALTATGLRYSSFISWPFPSWSPGECPICRRRADLERVLYTSSGYLRDFLDDWVTDLKPKDLYHDEHRSADWSPPEADPSSTPAGFINHSVAALLIAKYTYLIERSTDLPRLAQKILQQSSGSGDLLRPSWVVILSELWERVLAEVDLRVQILKRFAEWCPAKGTISMRDIPESCGLRKMSVSFRYQIQTIQKEYARGYKYRACFLRARESAVRMCIG